MTNFEKIKSMSAEEFTKKRHAIDADTCEQNKNGLDPLDCQRNKFVRCGFCILSPCDQCFLKWLESEVEE